MPSRNDQRGGLAQEQIKPEVRRVKKPEPKAPEVRAPERGRSVSPELAAQLQAQWGNQAIAQLIGQPQAAQIAASATEIRDETQDEDEQAEHAEATESERRAAQREQPGGRSLAAARGLPEASSGGGGPAADLDYGGDDDDPLPVPADGDGERLSFDRIGRQDMSRHRLRRSRSTQAAEAVQDIERTLSQAARVHSTGEGAAARGSRPATGDAVFRVPLEAWDDPALLAGRGCGPEDLEGLAGPFDGLGRPIAAARFVAGVAARPIARSLARLVAAAPGTLLPTPGGLTGAAARMGALATLALAAEGPADAVLRDRATRTALAEAALEAVLEVAGPCAEQVPPAHVLFQRIAGQRTAGAPPARAPTPAARRWIGAALRQAGQVRPFPTPVRWPSQPAPETPDPADPATLVDAALDDTAPASERFPRGAADAQPYLAAVLALLSAGGRAQVEVAAAAVASRRPAFDGPLSACLHEGYRAFQKEAAVLLGLRAEFTSLHRAPLAEASPRLAAASEALCACRERLHAVREICLDGLTAVAELG